VRKYTLELRSRAKSEEPFESKHIMFIEKLKKLESPWSLENLGSLPDIGDGLSVTVSLNKSVGKLFKGDLEYVFRGSTYLEDKAQYDDTLFIEFDPLKVDFSDIVSRVLPVYIDSFQCYRATIQDSSITRNDWNQVVELCNSTGKDIDGRDGVYRINAINYYDRELCQRAFGLSPQQIVDRLYGKIESVSLLFDGVMLIYSSKLLERDEIQKIDAEVKALLA